MARKRQMRVGWESMPCLTTSLRSSCDVKVDVPTWLFLLQQTKQVCQCTLRSVSYKGDSEKQARKKAEKLMTNVAKSFATGSVGEV